MRNLIILLLATTLFGCESKITYDISSDKAVEDMNKRIASLQEDLTTLDSELQQVKGVLNDPDIDGELRDSIKKEIHQGEKYKKEINQWLAFLKIRRKKRYNSLVDRKNNENLKKQAEKEVEAYFVDKKLNPLARPWLNRYRTAIEL